MTALVALLALASDTNYQNFVTGGRAVGLGGAFTAIANDASGLLFNPAGMVDDRHTDFSISANLYGFDRTARGRLPPSPLPSLNNVAQAANELVIIPSTTGFVRTFQRDPDSNGYLNAIGLGILVPSFRESSEQFRVQQDGNAVDYRRLTRDRVLMPGAGYARKIGRFRVGVSTFFNLRLIENQENVTTAAEGEPTAFRIADSTVKVTAASLLWVLGAKLWASDAVQLGLSLALPSLPVFSNASVRYYRAAFDPSVPSEPTTFSELSDARLTSAYQTPANLRFGTAYVYARKLTVSGDVSLHFPIAYELIRGRDLSRVLPFAVAVQRSAVVNINAGIEWMFVPTMSLSGGFYTDFASSQTLSGPAFAGPLDRQLSANIDYYGFTAAWSLISGNTLTRIGLLYTYGTGHDVRSREDFSRLLSESTAFERVEIAKSSLYLFLSSSVRFD